MSARSADAAPKQRYAPVAIILHWLTAAAFAFQIGLGWRLAGSQPAGFTAFQLHKSIGISILLLTGVRVAWRLMHVAPPLPLTLTSIERQLAKAAHRGFYLLLCLLPLTGWAIVSSSTRRVPTILFGVLPWPNLPIPAAIKHSANLASATGHYWLAWTALSLIALHVAGALKHQLVDRDGEFGRMAPLPIRTWSIAIGIAVLGFVGLLALGRTIMPDAKPAEARSPARAPSAPRSSESQPAFPARTAPVDAPPTVAKVVPPATDGAQPLLPSQWAVRSGSTVSFHSAWSQGPIDGAFRTWTADIVFDPAALDRSEVTVAIDMASVTAKASDQESALPNDDWLAAAVHPKAIFHATKFRARSKDRYTATGTLTLRGVTRPQSLDFTLTIARDVATMAGKATIDRTVFGVGGGEWASTADVPANVTVQIAIKADRRSK
jgi:cytochrome b561/polyisoprenoid-binding protein YceI